MVENIWLAPTAEGPISGTVVVPGSKSLTNRALVLAALADGPSQIRNALRSRDSSLMAASLSSLGAQINPQGNADLAITPIRSATHDRNHPPSPTPARTVDCGLAGTVMRFVPPIAALTEGGTHFTGDEAARQRPMAPLLGALRQLGAQVSPDDGLPFQIAGTGSVAGGSATIDASGSSQFISALLLAAARFDSGLTLNHIGPPVPSLPHIEMTVRMLAQHGVNVTANNSDLTQATWHVDAGQIKALDRAIEPDLSNAAPFAAAALITGGRIRISNWHEDSLQPLERVAEVFAELGGTLTAERGYLIATGSGRIRGITANLGDVGELVPTIAVLCALADGPSTLTGIGHLTGHETDRLAALSREINTLGGDVQVRADGLKINPKPLSSGPIWHTYHDHRMATAGAILGMAVPGLGVENITTTSETFPGFERDWRDLIALEPQPDAPLSESRNPNKLPAHISESDAS